MKFEDKVEFTNLKKDIKLFEYIMFFNILWFIFQLWKVLNFSIVTQCSLFIFYIYSDREVAYHNLNNQPSRRRHEIEEEKKECLWDLKSCLIVEKNADKKSRES